MLFITARLPQTDADARQYETRGVEALAAHGTPIVTHAFEVSDDGKNAERHAAIVALLKGLPDNSPVLISSSVAPLLGGALRAEARRLRAIMICHRPSARDPQFVTVQPQALAEVDASTLPYARRVVVPSLHTAMSIGVYGVLPDQLAVISPAADRAPLAEPSGSDRLTLITHAPIVHDAGHATILEALAAIRRFTFRWVCVAPASDRIMVAKLSAKADDLGVRAEWLATATSSEVRNAYHTADLALVAKHYDPHGVAVLEALARGVPVVAANAGAAGALVPKDAGVLVQPGDVVGLTQVLATLFGASELRLRLAQGAERARDNVRSWSRVGAELAREVDLACR